MMHPTDELETTHAADRDAERPATRHPAGPLGSDGRPGEPSGGRRPGGDGWSLDLDDGDIEADLFFGRD